MLEGFEDRGIAVQGYSSTSSSSSIVGKNRERLPWERMKGEGKKAYEYFVIYREMGDERSLAKVASAAGKTAKYMGTLSARHGWVGRAKAYDDYIVGRVSKELVRERESNAGKRYEALRGLVEKGSYRAEMINPEDISASEARQWIVEGSKGMRLEEGLATEVHSMDMRMLAAVGNPREILKGIEELIHAREAERDRISE